MKSFKIYLTLSIVRILISFLFSPRRMVFTQFIVPDLPEKIYTNLQDLNLGILMSMSNFHLSENKVYKCNDKLQPVSKIHQAVAVEFAVKRVNQNYKFLSGAKMGFVLLDDCLAESQVVLQALTFVPLPTCLGSVTPNMVKSYDVIGVIGSTKSSQTIALSQLLSPLEIPFVSFRSTSDELSDKASHPYFLRTIPPDRIQFEAIVKFIELHGWSYVSVVYDEGSYGENGLKLLFEFLTKKGKCLAAVERIPLLASDKKIEMIAEALTEKKSARIVVVITVLDSALRLLSHVMIKRHFIFIATDGWSDEITYVTDNYDQLLGSVLAVPYSTVTKEYSTYFKQLKPNNTSNPWFSEFWEENFQCNLGTKTCSSSLALAEPTIPSYVSRIIDTIDVYANATYRILNNCTKGRPTLSTVRQCVTGPRLLTELKNTDQNGYTGHITMDDNGDRLGIYSFYQVLPFSDKQENSGIPFRFEQVASFTPVPRPGELKLMKNLTWKYHSLTAGEMLPESRCSQPCKPTEAEIHQEVICCWLCQECRPNERVVEKGKKCEPCFLYTWPDVNTNLTTCKEIPVDKPDLFDVKSIVQTALACVSLSSCLAVLVFFVCNRKKNLIKNSLPQLSFLMLLSIVLGNVTIVIFQFEPNDFNCRVIFVLFCLSFTLMYGSLVIRALVNLNTFTSKSLHQESILQCMVSPQCQVLITLGLLLIQALMCSAVIVLYTTWHKKTMKEATVAYVELSCNIPDIGMASFLAYNLLIVVVCAYLSFKTRPLEDNYRESGYISMCMYTTMVIWLAFIPAYIVAGREYLKLLMMALTLFLNQALGMLFLFVPKIYAVLYRANRYEAKVEAAHSSKSNSRLSRASGSTLRPQIFVRKLGNTKNKTL